MSKLNQIKIPVDIEGYSWKLVRERDGLTNQSKEVLWLDFDDEGRFKTKHDKPEIGLITYVPIHSVLYLANYSNYRNRGEARRLY